jgi:two-component system, chemotaxis family, sensor kinase CheA
MSDMDEIVREFLVESTEGLDRMDRDLVELEKSPESRELLGSIFRAIHTVKGTSGVLGFPGLESVAHVGENLLSLMRDGKLRLTPEITSALLAMCDALRALLADIESTGQETPRDFSQVKARLSALAKTSSGETVTEELVGPALNTTAAEHAAFSNPEPGQPPEDTAAKQGEPRALNAAGSNIRVDVGLLDKVMNLVGELVLARNQVLQFTATQNDAVFLSTAQRLNLVTTELQEAVMKTRMQPIGNVWNKFPRLVRDLAMSCGRQVRIELEGSETELDKTIIEAIKDPLTHVVRNAIDHGIEPPEVRLAARKPAEGRLLLRAFHEGGHVNIEITDDGAGIDTGKVKQKALSRGLAPADQLAVMSPRELLELIFLPGFSTAEKVTNVSGRGVGMDVVKTNVEKIGGTVDVASQSGQGTTLKIKIPLTLAIIPALMVTSSGERFAIPQISLVELVRLEGEDCGRLIESIHGAPVYRLRGSLLPLVFLNRELGLGKDGDQVNEAVNMVVLQADGRQFGLVVDEINDTEEIVVKPLGKHLKGVTAFAGATIMGDGRVALILDVMGIAQAADVMSHKRDTARAQAAANIASAQVQEQKQQWLLFTAGQQSRMAVPLATVARLEEIKPENVERAGEDRVVQYRGEIMPLIDIAEHLRMPPAGERDTMQVIVHTGTGRSVGFIVDDILDVVEQSVAVEGEGERAGVRGSAVIQQKVTDLIDLQQIVAAAGLCQANPPAIGLGA